MNRNHGGIDPTPRGQIAATLAPKRGADLTVSDVVRLTGGASREIWAFEAHSDAAGSEQLILRRDPPGRPGPPGAMAREANAIGAAHQAGLPVPAVIAVDDGSTLGTAGLIMERIAGETRPRRLLTDDEYETARGRLTEQCGHFLARLHAIDPGTIEGLETHDPLAHAAETYAELGQVRPIFDLALRWLAENRPPANQPTVVHGDFRMGNLMVDTQGLRAVLDWELVHVADPLEDLTWLCVKAWRFREKLPVGGFGTIDNLLSAYTDAGGIAVQPKAFQWWLVLNTLKWGLICMTQAAAHLTGLVRSVELAAIGRRTCEQEWDLLELLAPDATAQARGSGPSAHPPVPGSTGGQAEDGGGAENAEGLHGRPTTSEILDAIREFLVETVVALPNPAVAFQGRVAANLVGMVERENQLGPDQTARHQRGLADLGYSSSAELASAIQHGRVGLESPGLGLYLAETARDRLLVANPRHLEL